MDDDTVRTRVAQVERALETLEGLPAAPRETALRAVGALVELYGEAFRRVLGRLSTDTVGELAGDELVGHLLLVHGLHPATLEERVVAGLEEVRPYLASHGGGVELVAVDGSTAHLRLEGSCHGCPSSVATLKLAVEDAIREAAPEIELVEADGTFEEPLPGVALPVVKQPPGPCPAGADRPPGRQAVTS